MKLFKLTTKTKNAIRDVISASKYLELSEKEMTQDQWESLGFIRKSIEECIDNVEVIKGIQSKEVIRDVSTYNTDKKTSFMHYTIKRKMKMQDHVNEKRQEAERAFLEICLNIYKSEENLEKLILDYAHEGFIRELSFKDYLKRI